MASINSVSGSNTISSLYNSANTISGLASGMDTEGMIESLVQSYQTKITSLNQKATKVEWQQEAYRSIISKMVGFSSKYTSYSSGTNLLSPSFFSGAVKVAAMGTYKDKVSASGKTDSDVTLNAVHQLATSAQFTTQGSQALKDAIGSGTDINGSALDFDKKIDLTNLSGSLVLTYGSKTVSLQFDEVEDAKNIQAKRDQGMSDAQALASVIEDKLKDEKITLSSGKSESAYDRIGVSVGGDGTISFTDKADAGNAVYISQASNSINSTLGIGDLSNAKESKINSFQVTYDTQLTKQESTAEYLFKRPASMNLNLDGTTKTVKMPEIVKSDDGKYTLKDGKELNAKNYAEALNSAVKEAFGNKVRVSEKDGGLHFEVNEGSDLLINTSVGDALGIGTAASTYLNTGKTLGDLLGDKLGEGLKQAYQRDSEGNYKLDSSGNKILDTDDKGNPKYEVEINGVVVGSYSKESSLSDIMSDINASNAGVKVSYSRTTKEFFFSAKDTGADSQIEIKGGLAEKLFGSTSVTTDTTRKTREYLGVDKLVGEEFSLSVGDKKVSVNFESNEGTLDQMLNKLNANLRSSGLKDVTASFDDKGALVLTRTDSNGEKVNVEYTAPATVTQGEGEDAVEKVNLAAKLKQPAIDYKAGQDAIFNVTVNGKTMQMQRSSNSVNIDGLTINMEETFNSKADTDEAGNPVYAVEDTSEKVTFKSSTDSDKIVDAIKTMIEDYNAMMSEIKTAYATMPYQKSSGAFANYEPLTEEERSSMSESAIASYEEKAKQGILFGDSTLSSLYQKMRFIFSPSGSDGAALVEMGIGIDYSGSQGAITVTLDEDKLRAMLDSDPDKVAQVFTKSAENGGADGIMQQLKTQMDAYAKTTGEPKGILIQRAGTPLSSLSLLDNTLQKQIDKINDDIETWQDKLSAQVDRYTSQFTRLELLISQMNSQSSTLAGLMGGGSY